MHGAIMSTGARLSSEEYDDDRISNLPDEMLQRILSFLETKEAVQKSLVSKRWTNLWRSLPSLNFTPSHSQLSFPRTPTIRELPNFWENNFKKGHAVEFKKYVETVLYHHQASKLRKFRVIFPNISDNTVCSDLVQMCVSYAMKHNCQVFSMEHSIPSFEIVIPVTDPGHFNKLCAPLFACESLEEMCLRTEFWNCYQSPGEIPEVVNLPHIRRLHLKGSTIDAGSSSRLLLGCPVLEELTLEYCRIEGLRIFNHEFKFLHLLNCGLELRHYKERVYVRVSIRRDTVESQIWIGATRVEFIRKFSSASTTDTTPLSAMRNLLECIDYDDYLRYLSGVTVLHIATCSPRMLDAQLKKLGVEFHNLRELYLSGWYMKHDFNPIASFLERAPNLQRLTLCKRKDDDISELIRAHKLEEALLPSCRLTDKKLVFAFH